MPSSTTLSGPSAVPLEPSDPPECIAVIDLDMDAVYQSAARRARMWRMEYDCDGAVFVATVTAKSIACADLLARRELADHHGEGGFARFGARLTGAEQLS